MDGCIICDALMDLYLKLANGEYDHHSHFMTQIVHDILHQLLLQEVKKHCINKIINKEQYYKDNFVMYNFFLECTWCWRRRCWRW